MWMQELESRLKEINYKINIQHKKTQESLDLLKDLYVAREDITDTILNKEVTDEQNN